MKAACSYGSQDVRVETVDDAKPINLRGAVLGIALSATCGWGLDLYTGFIPSMRKDECMKVVIKR